MPFTDRDGFIIAAREKFEADSKKTDEIKREVVRIRRLLEGTQQPQRRGEGSLAGGGGSRGPAQGGSPGSRPQPAGGAGGSRSRSVDGAGSRGAVPASRPAGRGGVTRNGVAMPAERGRNKLGQFTAGGQRKAPANGAGPSDANRDEEIRRSDRRQAELIDAIQNISERADGFDPAVSAANEVARAVQPVARGISKLFGKDPQKQQTSWLKKIWKALTERPANGSSIPGASGSVLDNLLSGPKKLLGLAGPAAAGLLGYMTGKGAAASVAAPGAAKPTLLSRLGKRLAPAGRFTRILGPLAAALDLRSGYRNDQDIQGDASLTAAQKREARLTNAANTGANLGGHIGGGAIGAAIGTAILPGIGTIIGGALGATFGPGLIKELSETLSPLIGDAVDFVKGLAGKAVELYDKAVAATSAGIEAVANSAPVKAVGRAYDVAVDYTSRGIEMAANAGKYVVGKISSLFESGKRGAGTISSGRGDFGGKSYGTYQLASKNGSLQSFLRTSPFGAEFAGMTPGSSAFDTKWTQLAKESPAFGESQHKYISDTHYGPQLAKLRAGGLDLGARGAAVQEAIFSTAVQFGANTGLIQNALKGKDVSSLSDANIVTLIQDYKAKNNSRLFGSSSPAVQASTLRRAYEEKEALLKLAAGGTGTAAQTPAMPGSATAPRVPMPATPKTPDAPRIPLMAVQNPIPSSEPITQDIGQNLSDRLLAHIQTGGIGSKG